MNRPICFILSKKIPLVLRLKILVALKVLLQILLFIDLFAIYLRTLAVERAALMSVADFITLDTKQGVCSRVMTLYPTAKSERIKVKNLLE